MWIWYRWTTWKKNQQVDLLKKKKKKKDEVSLGGRMAKKIGKHGGTRDKGEIAKILKLLIKRGNKKKDAMDMINKNYDRVSKNIEKITIKQS